MEDSVTLRGRLETLAWVLTFVGAAACGPTGGGPDAAGLADAGGHDGGVSSPMDAGGDGGMRPRPVPSLLECPARGSAPDCGVEAVRCVGAGQEYDSGVLGDGPAIQAALDAAQPGDRIALRGGTYRHDIAAAESTFLRVEVSGTEGSPITIEPYGDEEVVLEGFGFEEAGPVRRDERLLDVSGDHIHVRHLELRGSSRFGLYVRGSHGRFEDLRVHDSWESNILVIGIDRDIDDNHVRCVETYRSRNGSGIWILPSGSSPREVRGTLVDNVLAYHNGYLPDGALVSGGGGNSDGIGAFKGCAESAAAAGVPNLCPATVLSRVIAWHNADDGIDVSFGEGSELRDCISFDNGPSGNKGYKVYTAVREVTFVGNVALGNPSNGFESYVNFPMRFFHNTSVHNGLHGFRLDVQSAHGTTVEDLAVINNLASWNLGSRGVDETQASAPGSTFAANWSGETAGDPVLTDSGVFAIDTAFDPGWTLSERYAHMVEPFRRALTPAPGSPLIDAGELVPGVHCPTADDDSSDPADPTAPCRHWRGSAPDIGAFESMTP